MDLAKIKVDAARMEAGDWVSDLPGAPGLRLRVRGLGSLRYREALNRLTRAIPRSERNRDGSLPAKLNDRVGGEAATEALLLDWGGVTQDGVEVPYSRDLALKLLTDADFAAFRDLVFLASNMVAEDDASEEAKRLGNSAPPSNGGLSGVN